MTEAGRMHTGDADGVLTGDAARYRQVPVSLLDEPIEPLLSWAHASLDEAGYRVLSQLDARRRPWSTVVKLSTDRGVVWVKANARAFASEAGLLLLLASQAPRHVLPPIAAHPAVGWFITPDGGPVLEESGPASEAAWLALLTGYAELQRQLAPHLATLIELGLPDMTPPTLPEWWRRVLVRARREPHVVALFDAAHWAQLDGLLPETESWAAELGATDLPMTVEHNDLHADNVFVADGALRIFDWGDAVITHPFISLGRALQIAAEADPGSAGSIRPEVLREAYLRCWLPDPATTVPGGFHRAAELGRALSNVALAASWLRLAPGFEPEWAGWFAEFLTGYLECAEQLRSPR